jgi:hypothetical protein
LTKRRPRGIWFPLPDKRGRKPKGMASLGRPADGSLQLFIMFRILLIGSESTSIRP